ncbi:MAG: hypothetical protein AAF696_02680 [Bacteroidota bacterium]
MTQIKSKYTGFLALFLLLFLAISFQACDSWEYVIEKEFEGACWAESDTLSFQMEEMESQGLKLLMQFNQDYAYQNIYLKVLYRQEDKAWQELMINEILSDPLGNWKQEFKSGLYTFELPQSVEVAVGSYQLKLFQFMREENLCGVHKIGILK